MNDFKEALSQRYGVFGDTAFESTLALRYKEKKSLRSCDIKKTLSKIDSIKQKHFKNEINRQLVLFRVSGDCQKMLELRLDRISKIILF